MPWQFLYFLPLPQGQGALRAGLAVPRTGAGAAGTATPPDPRSSRQYSKILRNAGAIAATLAAWRLRSRTRRQLAMLDARALADLGLTPDGYLLLDGDDGRRHTILAGGVRPEN